MKFIKLPKRTAQVSEFNTLACARSAALDYIKPHVVLLGDYPLFWVASLGDAAALIRAGYELAN